MFTADELAQLRADTRGAEARIHFNNAGASLPPRPVADTVRDYLEQEEWLGGYETADARMHELLDLYPAAAALLNTTPDAIAFVDSATRAWALVFYSLALGPGDRILTSEAEYGSNMVAYLHRARRDGVEVVIIPSDATGQIDLEALERAIDGRTRLIAMSHIPTGGGLVNPAEAVGAIARRHGVLYLLDACQSVGQMPVDVHAIGCDFLSTTGRKYLRGPRGTGLLYVAPDRLATLEPVLMDQCAADLLDERTYALRSDARRFELWERHCAGQAGLAVALRYAQRIGLGRIEQRIGALAERLRTGIAALPGFTVHDQGTRRCGLVTFKHERFDVETLKAALSEHHINVSISRGSGSRVSFDRRGIDALVRASVHYYNLESEVDRVVEVLGQLVRAGATGSSR